MNKIISWLTLLVFAAAGSPCGAIAQNSRSRPEVWMMPSCRDNGRAVRELFTNAAAWSETRALVDVFGCTDLNIDRLFSDDELRDWLAKIGEWHIKLGLEVGAIKPWGETGAKTFAIEKPKWDRIEKLGGKIYAIAMDEPLICARQQIKKPDDYAVEETASYIALVRQSFPDIRVGDIECYPATSLADHLWWIDALQKKLAEKKVRGLDFYRLDVDWNHFTIGNKIYAGNWPEVRKLETACRQRNLPFSLIYWAADYPHMKKLEIADDATWYVGVMRQGYDYTFVDGRPDQVVIESWVGAPTNALPETADFTFTRSVRDFCNRFLKSR
jgi:hypothetical protein